MGLIGGLCEDSEDGEELAAPPARLRDRPDGSHQRSTSSTNAQLRDAHSELFANATAANSVDSPRKRAKRLDDCHDIAPSSLDRHNGPASAKRQCIRAEYTSSAVQDAIHEFMLPTTNDTVQVGTGEREDLIREALEARTLPPSVVENSSLSVSWPSATTKTPSSTRSKAASRKTTTPSSDLQPSVGLPPEQYVPRPSRSRSTNVDLETIDWSVRPEAKRKKKQSAKKLAVVEDRSDEVISSLNIAQHDALAIGTCQLRAKSIPDSATPLPVHDVFAIEIDHTVELDHSSPAKKSKRPRSSPDVVIPIAMARSESPLDASSLTLPPRAATPPPPAQDKKPKKAKKISKRKKDVAAERDPHASELKNGQSISLHTSKPSALDTKPKSVTLEPLEYADGSKNVSPVATDTHGVHASDIGELDEKAASDLIVIVKASPASPPPALQVPAKTTHAPTPTTKPCSATLKLEKISGIHRVGLSKRQRIQPLLRIFRK